MAAKFRIGKLAVIGVGLIGGSFALALKKARAVRRVVGVGRTRRNLALAKRRGIIDETALEAADAVRDAERMHLVVSDDAAVDAVLAAARPAKGSTVFDHTTTSTAGARERTSRLREGGITYVHAPVFMGPANALEGTGFMLVSGDRDTFYAREIEARRGRAP